MKPSNVRWQRLYDYNAEVARGIVHTAEYDAKMRDEQERYDRSREHQCVVCRRPATYCLRSWNGDVEVWSCAACRDLVNAVHA